ACVAKNRALNHVGADKWVPYVEWIGRKPNVDMLRVFGCTCMALVPKHLRHNKLGAKAIWAVHLGMAQNSKGWLLWDPFTKKFLVSRDCKFMENLMYKDWKAENEAKICMRFGEVKSSGLEHVELPLEQSSSSTTTRQSSLVNGGEEAKDAEEEEEEVQQVSERAPTLPSRTTSAPQIRVTPQQRQGLHVPAAEEEGRGKRRIQALNRLTYDALGKPAKLALAGAALMVGDDEESDYEECAFAFFSPVEMPGEPATLKEAMESSDAEEWKKAMESELKSIEENGTWELMELPEGRKAITSKWLFKIKSNADGKIERYKSRLVAKGYQQKDKVDYKELFAPVCVKGPEEESVGEEERRRFHSLVGSLMYAAVNTRPDAAFATRKAGDPTEPGPAGAEGAGAGGTGAGGAGAGGAGAGGIGVGGAGAGGAGAIDPGAGGAGAGGARGTGVGGTVWPRPVPRPRPSRVPGTHAMALRPSSVPLRVPLPAPPESSLPAVPDPESDRACAPSPTVSRLLPTVVNDPSFESTAASALVAELLHFAAAYRLDYAVALVAESESANSPSVGGECALGTDVLEDTQEDFECLATAVPRFASMLLTHEGDPDAPDIPTPRSYAEAITGPYSSQWKTAMDAEITSWKSTGSYVDAVPPPWANKFDGMWIFRVSLHEEIWLRRPTGFTRSFPAGTQWSLRRPVYGLRQAPREWHDTLRTTLAAQGFTPSTADLSLFLHTDTSLPPFYVLMYVDDLVFATTDTEALTLVKLELQKRHTYTDLEFSSPQPTPLSTGHSLSAPPSDESVEPSGPYPELVGCLITSGMGLVLGGRGPVVLTGHGEASWVDDSATQRSSQGYTFSLGSGSVSWRSTRSSSVLSSSCEAEIYAGAMAAQELRWLTYLLTDLGEQPRLPPVLYVDNKAMIALCQEHRMEHRTKHIALRYFLARELQQRGQLRRAYVATRANTADIFTKALPPGDHQRFSTVLGLMPTLPHLLSM
ncbi:unnamed protein product, partial [Closterium sp. NIES-53]